MDNPQILEAQPVPTNPQVEQPLPQESLKKSHWSKLIMILIVVLVLAGAVAYYSLHKPTVNPNITKETTTPAPTNTLMPTSQPTTTNSLNPNTGNLYTDIKDRLNQVIK